MANVRTLEDLETEEPEEHDWGEGQVLDTSKIFDDNTELDFPRSDVIENEDLIGTPGYGNDDFDDWEQEDVRRRLKRLSKKDREDLKKRVTYTKKRILTKLIDKKLNKGEKVPYPINFTRTLLFVTIQKQNNLMD